MNTAKPKILVVGSFVMDQIATTSVVPGSGETVLGKSFHKIPGGKGANQAVQAARLGADVTMVGKLGHDANGEELLKACQEAGIHTEYVLYDQKAASGCSVIVLHEQSDASCSNRIIVIPGSNMTITPEDVAFLEEKIADFDLVMLQLEIPMEVNETVARYAAAKKVPVMLNSAPSAPLSDELLGNLTFISPNEHEAEDITGVHIEHHGAVFDQDAAFRASAILHGRGVENVLITLGSSGAVFSGRDGILHHGPCISTHVVDPTAAGDSFIGAFCTGFCCGWSEEELLRFSNHTASLTVSGMGAMSSLPYLEQVENYMKARGASCPDLSLLKA